MLEPAARFRGEVERALLRAGTVVRECERQLEHRGFPRRVARRRQREPSLTRLHRRLEVVVLGREVAEVRQQLDAQRKRHLLGRRQRSFDERTPFGDALGRAEVPPEPDAESSAEERIGRVASVAQGGPEVVVLALEPFHPGQPLRRAQPRLRRIGQRREVLGVRLPRGGETAAFVQTLEHVLADGVEQVVPSLAIGEGDGDDRLVDQRAQQVGDRWLVKAVASGDSEQRRQRSPSPVHGELVEQRLLVDVQQVIAPVHEVLEGARLGSDAGGREAAPGGARRSRGARRDRAR